MRIFRKLAQMLDVDLTGAADNDSLTYDAATGKWVPEAVSGGPGGGAPTDVDYLVGTASGDLSAEIVVGTTPGGELGGTWASPTVDATHSGSSHASVQAAAEATAASALSSHASDTTGVHGIADTSALETSAGAQAKVDAHVNDTTDAHAGTAITNTPAGNIAATTVQAAINELDTEKAAAASAVMDGDSAGGVLSGTYPNPGFASDMATQAELDAHVNDSSAAHAASAISADSTTLVGTGTDVQAVLEELDNAVAVAYTPGGTDVALADGGTGASLSDPNADRILFWDDSAGHMDWLTAGSGLSISGTTITASGGGGGTITVPIVLLNPQAAANLGNSFFTVAGLTDWDAGHWEFVKDVDGKVYGRARVPANYSSGGTLKLAIAANATSGVTRLGLGTKAVADGESVNPTLTDETKQDITVPGTAYLQKVVSFTLNETLAAGDLLIVEIFHEGSHANDTLAVNTLLMDAWLEVTV